MQTHNHSLAGMRTHRGISLIIVLVMLVIIGITASTAMRTATSEQRATNNIRKQADAQQFAEAALRICEGQMKLATASRKVAFRSPLPASTLAAPRWNVAANWTAVTAPSGRYDFTAADNVSDANTNAPTWYPQCLVELQTIPAVAFVPASPGPPATLAITAKPAFTMTVITARGFSSDYARNGAGQTTQGAVVWLQSIVNAE